MRAETATAMPRPPRAAMGIVLLLLLGGAPRDAAAQSPDPAEAAVRAGLENASAAPGETLRIAYENRRWRHAAEALGRLRESLGARAADSAAAPPPFLAFERRLGLVSAAIRPPASPAGSDFVVRYPSDPSFPTPPRGPVRSPTAWRPDLELQPLLGYELGRVFDPVLVRLALSPRIRLQPWPGALATAAAEIPVRNDFDPDPLHPDIDELRPGQLTLDQYLWLPRAALASLSSGYFGDNRWGVSLGAARPFAQGAFLLDGQADLTGFVTFGPDVVEYSTPERWTGFGSLTWRPDFFDLAIRARAESYLLHDRGGELEVRRSMGDFDLGFFVQRSAGVNDYGVRAAVPLPPPTRAAGRPLRVQPADRWPFEHRGVTGPTGQTLHGLASREDFLRQLSRPALAAQSDRWRLARGTRPRWLAHDSLDWVSWTGTTGFVNTPWAGSMGDRQFEAGFGFVPRHRAYDQRDRHDNHVYSVTVGFLPWVEAALRATAFPGFKSFQDVVPGSELTDTDEMASGRIVLLAPRLGRPGLAVGVEDAQGTRRFHSTYAVAGLPLRWRRVAGRVTGGYAPRILDATRYVLDGGFGALEIDPWPFVAAQVEHDSEKWNAGLAVRTPYGIRLRGALLGMDRFAWGVGFHFAL